MKYSVLKKIKFKTSKGEIELLPGQMVALNNDVATRLISKGRISSIGEITEEANSGTIEPTVTKSCIKCGNQAERYCYGEVSPGMYNWGRFCLACYPHHF